KTFVLACHKNLPSAQTERVCFSSPNHGPGRARRQLGIRKLGPYRSFPTTRHLHRWWTMECTLQRCGYESADGSAKAQRTRAKALGSVATTSRSLRLCNVFARAG